MPSFIVHSISGRYITDYLNLDNERRKEFFIGNLLPDSTNLKLDSTLTDLERRQKVQHEKETTHFRSNLQDTIEYPDIDKFLMKYKEECKNNLTSFAYFFHLYTDYYFFKLFLPRVITTLDINQNKETIKEKTFYVKINKTGKIMTKQDFWNKTESTGIYQEYTRLNKYLIKKYNFSCDIKDLLNFLDSHKLITNITEINPNNGSQVINKLNRLLTETENCTDYNLQIFEETDIEKLISEVVESFKEKYSDILNNYKGD